MELTENISDVYDKDFDKLVLKSKIPVIVDFWAPWCGPCRLMAPVIDELSKKMQDIKFLKMDVDENKKTSEKYEVYSIPTLILFKNGKEKDRIIGFLTKDELTEAITEINQKGNGYETL